MPASKSARLEPGVIAAANRIARFLEANGLAYTLVGGVAVSGISRPRSTRDVDVLVMLETGVIERLLAAEEFAPRIADAARFALKANVLLLADKASGVDLDILLGVLPFEREMIRRARTLTFGGITARFPRVQELLAMKLIAARNRDLADAEELSHSGEPWNMQQVMSIVQEFSDVLENPEIVATAKKLLDNVKRKPQSGKPRSRRTNQ
jgi:predicted nucleotidyltransferase